MATLLLIGDKSFQDFLYVLLNDCNYEIIQSNSIENASNLFDKYRIKLDGILVHREISPDSVDLLVEHIHKQEPFLPIVVFSYQDHELSELAKKQCEYFHWIPRDKGKTSIIEIIRRVISESKVLVHKK